VVHHHRFGFRPWIGEVVDGVKQLAAVVQSQFHQITTDLLAD
jgi:hypothetical protein